MHPIVAALLAVLLLTLGLMAVRFALSFAFAWILVGKTKDVTVSVDDVVYMAHTHWLRRAGRALHPLAFWWLYLFIFARYALRKRG